ncbi:cell division protein FtsQ/DivIB [Piscinibacter sp. XHJ-5]|uniref:cell division protein FtsQ/DivIB n=1 Tax=Piscinibacter sp. XHJ-5 TaxID=3037797 RepID=UPI00245362C0|nr:cell division protein FtsQ/DivIB [Piscinibacter sp. XHJ-5]
MAAATALDPRTAPLPGDVRLMHATASALYVLAGIALAALLLNWMVRLPAFALRMIQVEGDVTRNSVSTIRANAAPKLSGNFFTTDLVKGKRAFESVPWVRQAVVKRVWPNRLAVRLEEHRPAAVWGGSDTATDKLVNSYGEVFEANLGDVEDDSLPTLSGPDGSSVHMLAMLNQLRPLFERLDARVAALSLSGRGSWRAELDTGAEVELGRGTDDEVLARTERFIGTLTQVTSRFQRPLEYADLRHHDGYAVRLKGITTVIPTAKERKN